MREPYVIHINTIIVPNNWSVLATDESKFKYICTSDGNDILKLKILDCSKVFDICEFLRTRSGDNDRKNYRLLKY